MERQNFVNFGVCVEVGVQIGGDDMLLCNIGPSSHISPVPQTKTRAGTALISRAAANSLLTLLRSEPGKK